MFPLRRAVAIARDVALLGIAALLLVWSAAEWRSGRARMTGGFLPRHDAARAESPLAFRLWVGAKAAVGALLGLRAALSLATP